MGDILLMFVSENSDLCLVTFTIVIFCYYLLEDNANVILSGSVRSHQLVFVLVSSYRLNIHIPPGRGWIVLIKAVNKKNIFPLSANSNQL